MKEASPLSNAERRDFATVAFNVASGLALFLAAGLSTSYLFGVGTSIFEIRGPNDVHRFWLWMENGSIVLCRLGNPQIEYDYLGIPRGTEPVLIETPARPRPAYDKAVPGNLDPRVKWNKLGFSKTTGEIEMPSASGIMEGSYSATVYPYSMWTAPVWPFIVMAALMPLLWLRTWFRTNLRRRRGLCENCSYDLRASRERCPECGTRFVRN